MSVWVLKPADTAAPSWKGYNPESAASIVIEAETELAARTAAAASVVVDQKVHDYSIRPDQRSSVSPWLDPTASSCLPAERIAALEEPVITVSPEGPG